ncbi:hypothetical protein WMZ97_09150 [Lentibacillus sp. N15]|uniref:hypothetical protein n=1 Tax=Lentibacillus songyuanensis TaxID=3136161 RepID=UPI0031B9E430
MITEINFIKRQPNNSFTPILLGIIVVLLLTVVVAVALFQKNHYTEMVNQQEETLAALEQTLAKQHEQVADEQQIQKMKETISLITSEATPNVALYQHVVSLLPNKGQLISYDTPEENELVVGASFKTLEDAANYVSALADEAYIQDVQLTTIDNDQSAYETTLTVKVDSDIMHKEFDNNA